MNQDLIAFLAYLLLEEGQTSVVVDKRELGEIACIIEDLGDKLKITVV